MGTLSDEELDAFLSNLGLEEETSPPQVKPAKTPSIPSRKGVAMALACGVCLGFLLGLPLNPFKEAIVEIKEESLLDDLAPHFSEEEIIEPINYPDISVA